MILLLQNHIPGTSAPRCSYHQTPHFQQLSQMPAGGRRAYLVEVNTSANLLTQ